MSSSEASPEPSPTSPPNSADSPDDAASGPTTRPMKPHDCAICLLNLPVDEEQPDDPVARLLPCAHAMHDSCIRHWIERANTCPVCRASFNEVEVCSTIAGPALHSYDVQDRIQVPEQRAAAHVPDHRRIPRLWECGRCSLPLGGNRNVVMCDGCHSHFHLDCANVTHPYLTGGWVCADVACAGARHSGVSGVSPRALRERYARLIDDGVLEADWNAREGMYTDTPTWNRAADFLRFDLRTPYWGRYTAGLEPNGRFGPEEMPVRQLPLLERSAVIVANLGDGDDALFEDDFEENAWRTQRSRVREEMPVLVPQDDMDEVERDAWKDLDALRELEEGRKRRRSPSDEGSPTASSSAVSTAAEQRTFKRPRTKRTTEQIQEIIVPESSATAAARAPPSAGATSPGSGGLFTTLLDVIGKPREQTIEFPSTDLIIQDLDLGRMRPMSPESSNAPSPSSIGSPGSAPRSPTFSPSSPAASPLEPIRGRTKPRSRTPRTPAASPTRVPAWALRSPSPNPTPGANSTAGPSSPADTSPAGSDREGSPPPGPSREEKEDVVSMVKSALRPFFPEKISKEMYIEINKQVSRKLYTAIVRGVKERARWKVMVDKEVARAVNEDI